MTRYVLERPEGRLTVNSYGDRVAEPLPVLFAHPINLRGSAWARVVAAFATERLCVVPDMRGFGDSDPADRYHVSLWAQDCLDAADAVGIARFHVVGGSLGGPIAVYLAGTQPHRVASVMAVGSQLHSEDPDSAAVLSTLETRTVPEMFAEIIPEYSLGPGASRLVIDETLATTNPNGPDEVRKVWKAAASTDVRDVARSVRCPVTVVTGEHDLTCPPDAGKHMAEQLHGAHILMPGIGHLPMLEAPETLVGLIRDHLSRVKEAA